MILTHLELTQFRNFQHCKLLPNSRLNIIVGINGSGKSSLIESIYLFGFGRSFRTSKQKALINNEKDSFTVFVKSDEFKAGVTRDTMGEIVCQINGESLSSISKFVSNFPVQLFTPQSTDLFFSSPQERRKFVDWGVFHVEHSSQSIYRKFAVTRKQRNAFLKRSNIVSAELLVWDKQFVEASIQIDIYRQAFIKELTAHFYSILKQFLPEIELQIEYNRGWNMEANLEDLLKDRLSNDLLNGSTSIGPHKADLRIKVGTSLAVDILSRGQLRMVVAAIQLAQTKAFESLTNKESIFLLDDLGAELDKEKRELFLDSLVESKSQVFVTAIEQQQLSFINKYDNKKMFHVEHGRVTEE